MEDDYATVRMYANIILNFTTSRLGKALLRTAATTFIYARIYVKRIRFFSIVNI